MILKKTSNRVIAFLMCVLVMLTVCVFQPINEARALVGIDDAALVALILALLAGCGVAIEVTTDEGLQGIAEDYWNSASSGAKTLIQDLKNKMTSYTDPYTNNYVKSTVPIGIQEYIDINESVRQYAVQRIINGSLTTVKKNIPLTPPAGLTATQWNSILINPIFLSQTVTMVTKTSNGYYWIVSWTPTSQDILNGYIFSSGQPFVFPTGWNYANSQNGWGWTNYYNNSNGGMQYPGSTIYYSDYNLYTGSKNSNPTYIFNNAPEDLINTYPAKKLDWTYELLGKWYDENILHPENEGELDFTVNVENPSVNLNPSKVLPAELTPVLPDISTPATPPNYNEMPNTDRPSLKAKFISVFPFCLPWDLKQAFALLAAEPEAPYFSVDFLAPVREKIGITGSTTITLDMDEYPMVGEIIRWTVLISFSISLILVTRKIIKS